MKNKAVILLSGGLDSALAVSIMKDLGTDLWAVNFTSPFCNCNRKDSCKSEATKVCEREQIPLKVLTTGQDYIDMLKHPKHPRGRGLNSCVDCRIFMFRKAKKYMEEIGASFIVTGEVLDQRPMSQRRKPMHLIEKEIDLQGLIVRPLSAQRLEPSLPEQAGIVDREKMCAISGRSRKPQMALAEKYAIGDYPCPAGGCLLTEKHFSAKLQDLYDHDEEALSNVVLLRFGRHFRSTSGQKILVGRNDPENMRFLGLAKADDTLMTIENLPGPTILIKGPADETSWNEAVVLMARYSDYQAEQGAFSVVKIVGGTAGEPQKYRDIPTDGLDHRNVITLIQGATKK